MSAPSPGPANKDLTIGLFVQALRELLPAAAEGLSESKQEPQQQNRNHYGNGGNGLSFASKAPPSATVTSASLAQQQQQQQQQQSASMSALERMRANKLSRTGRNTVLLRLATNMATIRQGRGGGASNFLVSSDVDWDDSHLKNLEGFFVILTESGVVDYVSSNVLQYAKTGQRDVLGKTIYDLSHPRDHNKIRRFLSRKKNNLPERSSRPVHDVTDDARVNGHDGADLDGSSPREPRLGWPERGSRQFFHFRLMADGEYNHFNLMGHYRRIDSSTPTNQPSSPPPPSAPPNADGDPSYLFVGVVRPVKGRPMTELSLMEAVQDQYFTRHLPNGLIIYADHRVATTCGYLPSEIVGKAGMDFILGEDLPWTAMAQRHMMANLSSEGFSTYRLRCKDGNYITVQSRGYLEYNRHTQKIESFMCVNTVLKDKDGERYLQEQKDRFTPYIIKYKEELQRQNRDTQENLMYGLLEDARGDALRDTNHRKRALEHQVDDDDVQAIEEVVPVKRSRGSPESTMTADGDDDAQYLMRADLKHHKINGHRVIETSDAVPRPGEDLSRIATWEGDDTAVNEVDELKRVLQSLQGMEENDNTKGDGRQHAMMDESVQEDAAMIASLLQD